VAPAVLVPGVVDPAQRSRARVLEERSMTSAWGGGAKCGGRAREDGRAIQTRRLPKSSKWGRGASGSGEAQPSAGPRPARRTSGARAAHEPVAWETQPRSKVCERLRRPANGARSSREVSRRHLVGAGL